MSEQVDHEFKNGLYLDRKSATALSFTMPDQMQGREGVPAGGALDDVELTLALQLKAKLDTQDETLWAFLAHAIDEGQGTP